MKINKQLFEDVLSGKLKGTFIRRDGTKLDGSLLVCGGDVNNRTYAIGTDIYYIYYETGIVHAYPDNSNLDLIEFIPSADMKEKELQIEIPDGKVINWDESKKQNKIVLKDKRLTYEDICEKLFKDNLFYSIAWEGCPVKRGGLIYSANNATTAHQLECILAKNKLANVAKYLNDGWKPTIEEDAWYIISYGHDNIDIVNDWVQHSHCSSRIIFKSEELAQQAIEILGEETVKLALKPLGI